MLSETSSEAPSETPTIAPIELSIVPSEVPTEYSTIISSEPTGISLSLPSLSILSIEIASLTTKPTSTSTVFAWTILEIRTNPDYPYLITSWACSNNSQYVFGISGNLLSVSNNYGLSFASIVVSDFSDQFSAVAVSSNGRHVVCSVSYFLYYSNNFGNTFSLSDVSFTNVIEAIAMSNSGQIVLVAGVYQGSTVAVSTDFGKSFSELSVTLPAVLTAVNVAISGEGNYMMVGGYILATSNNSGANWTYPSLGNCYTSFLAVMSDNGKLQTVACSAKIYNSNDYGITWYLVSSVPFSLSDLVCASNGTLLYGIESEDNLWQSFDQGVSWSLFLNPAYGSVGTDDSGQYVFTNSLIYIAYGYTPYCPPGTVGTVIADGYECTDCPPGYYADTHTTQCTICPAGYYTDYYGSYACIQCPAGTYSTSPGSQACSYCPVGMTSYPGTTTSTGCANVTLNIGMAFVLLFLVLLGVTLYIVGGRLQRMAFVRKERLVKKSQKMFYLVMNQLQIAGVLCHEVFVLRTQGHMTNIAKLGRFLIVLVYSLFYVSFVAILFLIYLFSSVLRVFFTSMILWRGYNVYLNVQLIERVEEYISHMLSTLHIEFFHFLFNPFVYVLNFVAGINLNFNTIQVNCAGCQVTMQLFLDCIIVGVAVIIIQSDMEVYWSTAFADVHSKFRSLLLQKHFWKIPRQTIKMLFWSTALVLIPHPRKILQYGLGFVRISVFFSYYGLSLGSPVCDAASHGADTVLAVASSIIAYISAVPVFYLLSHIIVPQFKLQSGTVKAEESVRRQTSRKAENIYRCGKCDLGLHRYYTSHFGQFHCDNPEHTSHSAKISNPMHSDKSWKIMKYVVYGCPSMTTCDWAVCDVCYDACVEAVNAKKLSIEHSLEASYDSYEMTADNDSTRRSSVVERPKKIWSNWLPYVKKCLVLLSWEWFYVKLTFEFAQSLLKRICTVNTTLIQDLRDARNEKDISTEKIDLTPPSIPKLPWFYAMHHANTSPADQLQEEWEIQELERKWNRSVSEFPSYYRMVITVQDDLLPKAVHTGKTCSRCSVSPIVGKRFILNDCEDVSLCEACKFASDKDDTHCTEANVPGHCFVHRYCFYLRYWWVVLISWTLYGQLRSERGRRIWARVFRNYFVFFRIVFGFWTIKATRDFNLMSRFEELECEAKVSAEAQRKVLTTVGITQPEGELDLKSDRMTLVSALVSCRVVLLQLVPYLTLLSTLAVDISASPVLITNMNLVDKLPPLFVFDAVDRARSSLIKVGSDTAAWKVNGMSLYLIVQESRSIQFLLNVLSNLVAFGLIYSDKGLLKMIIFGSTLLFIVTSFVQCIYPVILLHKMLFPPTNPTDDEKKTDDRDSVNVGIAMTSIETSTHTTNNPIVMNGGGGDDSGINKSEGGVKLSKKDNPIIDKAHRADLL